MDKLSAAIVLLSQGVPFLELGQDFLRSKPIVLKDNESFGDKDDVFNGNSYNAPDETNSIKWNQKQENHDVFKYYKALIKIRKKYPQLRLSKREDVEAQMKFFDTGDSNIIGYSLEDKKSKDKSTLVIIVNPYTESRTVKLPEGEYTVMLNPDGKDESKTEKSISDNIQVEAISAVVLLKK